MALAVLCGVPRAEAAKSCAVEQAELSEVYKERRGRISEDLTELMDGLGRGWQSDVTPTLENMGQSVSDDLKAAETEAERAAISAAYHAKRKAYLDKATADYHAGRRIAQRAASERLAALDLWWQQSVRALRTTNDCQEALGNAIAQDYDADRRLDAFGKEAPMDQAAAEFHQRTETKRALDNEIAAAEARLKGRTDTLGSYNVDLSDAVEEVQVLMGNSGLGGVAPALGQKVIDRLEAIVFPEFPDGPEPVELTVEVLEQQVDPRRELTRPQIEGKIADKVSGDLRNATRGFLHGAFEDAIDVMIEQSTLPQKVRLLNRIDHLKAHRDGLEDLIENDRTHLEDLRKQREAANAR